MIDFVGIVVCMVVWVLEMVIFIVNSVRVMMMMGI